MVIFDRLVTHVTDGGRYKIDLKNKTLKIGKEVVIDEGRYEGELIGDLPCDPWEMADKLFDNYYNSRSSAWSDKQTSKYFKAKDSGEMDFTELVVGEPRLVAKAKLEGYILCAVLAGYLKWNPMFGNWFWKSPVHNDFVLLREWF